jgi:hypothetical protein
MLKDSFGWGRNHLSPYFKNYSDYYKFMKRETVSFLGSHKDGTHGRFPSDEE